MPRLRPPDDVRNLSPADYREARKRLSTDEFHKQQRALAQRSEEQRKQRLADSSVDLLAIRDACLAKGLSIEDACRFAGEIEQLRSRKDNAQ